MNFKIRFKGDALSSEKVFPNNIMSHNNLTTERIITAMP